MLTAAADIALAGLDPFEFLSTRNGQKRALMQKLAFVILDRDKERDQSRAVRIANEIGKVIQAGFKRR